MTDAHKLVSVIVVNYNGAPYIEECLQSLYRQTYRPVEIVVVDNGSTDRSLDILRGHGTRIKLIESAVNLGFAAGNNEGIRRSAGSYVALLNNDASAHPDWIRSMADTLDRDARLGACSCRIVSHHDHGVLDSIGLLINREGMSRGEGRNGPADAFGSEKAVLMPSACASLYRREAIEEAGLFDEDFFCYCEDTDLGLRLRLLGWEAVYAPQAVAYHRYSESAGKYSAFKAYHIERNHFWVLIKNYPAKYVLLSPLLTVSRYFYQLLSVLRRRGATAAYAQSASAAALALTLLRAHAAAWRGMPAMLRKRRRIRQGKRVSDRAFDEWLKRHSIAMDQLFDS